VREPVGCLSILLAFVLAIVRFSRLIDAPVWVVLGGLLGFVSLLILIAWIGGKTLPEFLSARVAVSPGGRG
jgi:hypothetical protein